MPRTNTWLLARFRQLAATHFSDILEKEKIVVRFGRNSYTRLGSIRRRNNVSIITVTGYFRDDQIPETVIDETLGHELVHYSHGFESPMPRLYKYPHAGGVVVRSLHARGLGKTHQDARLWLRENWKNFIIQNAQRTKHLKRPKSRKTFINVLTKLLG